jgi:tripartite-type tricarboxylate transporter receptor subunit TctC
MRTCRLVFASCVALITILQPVVVAAAQSVYPARPIRLIVGVPPGGAADFTARIVSQKLVDALGQNLVVENRGGAGGTIASDIVSKSAPDGHTLLWSSVTTHGIGPVLYTKLTYEPLKDFTHIGLAASLPMIMVVHNTVPVSSVKELIAYAKGKPNALHFASSSSGSLPHLVGELFKAETGAPIVHVPYKGSGPAVVDLAAGNVQIMFDAPPALYGQIKAGRLRVLASVYSKRSGLFPDAPTLAELGFPRLNGVIWYGVSGPAGLSPAVVRRLSDELRAALTLPDTGERFAQQGAIPTFLSPQQYTAFIQSEMAKWGAIVKSAGAKVD